MLSGQGWTAVSGCRQFFYARYLDWMITFPLITILLGQIAGCEWTVIFGAIGAQRAFPSSSLPHQTFYSFAFLILSHLIFHT